MKVTFKDSRNRIRQYDTEKGAVSGITAREVVKKYGMVVYRFFGSDKTDYTAKVEKSKIHSDLYNVFIDGEFIFKSDDINEIFNTFLQW
jgi:hypothetical protein